jgi:hypothetical protein
LIFEGRVVATASGSGIDGAFRYPRARFLAFAIGIGIAGVLVTTPAVSVVRSDVNAGAAVAVLLGLVLFVAMAMTARANAVVDRHDRQFIRRFLEMIASAHDHDGGGR